MILIILIAAVVIVAGLLIAVSMRPDAFRYTRSATIPAPASALFEQVNDFHNWEAWSPWAKMDPTAKNTFSGAHSGVGAKFSWEGNNKVGKGEMTLLESRPNDLIQMKLEFFRPMKAVNTAEFTFQPVADGTLVTWSMWGKNNFMGKAFGLMMDCDKMCGSQFEQGLANLRAVVESGVTAKV